MHFYKHHIGDYAAATSHLSILEDGVFRRLLSIYYRDEKPLPLEPAAVQRLAGARSEDERAAVLIVLHEFFEQRDDGWHNKRADQEIEAFHIAEAESEAKRENEAERQRRSRERRKELFDSLRTFGVVPPYNMQTSELEGMLSRVRHADATRTDTANQTPDSRLQDKEQEHAADAAPARPRRRSTKCTFDEYLAACKEAGEQAVPPDDPVFAYADEIGLPREYVRIAWVEFRGRFCGSGKDHANKQVGIRGWRQHFGNAVRGCWGSLWAINRDGEYYLTTSGKQAEAALAKADARKTANGEAHA